MNFLDKQVSFNVLQKALNASTLRHSVISNNIANINTPLFKRSEVDFENKFAEILNLQETAKLPQQTGQIPLFVTNAKHISNIRVKEIQIPKLEATVHQAIDESMRNDQNNVDIDKETADMAKNGIYYQGVTRQLGGYINSIKQAIEGR